LGVPVGTVGPVTIEQDLRDQGLWPAAFIDECGRGSWAGPVVVCALVPGTGPVPDGVADSKLVSKKRRPVVASAVRDWASAWAVGSACAAEVDQFGIVTALRLAGLRALAGVAVQAGPLAAVVLDGPHDYLHGQVPAGSDVPELAAAVTVVTGVKLDVSEPAVSAASLVGKVFRDELMGSLAGQYPGYGWESNAGYVSPAHRAGLAALGVTDQHRVSWRGVCDYV